MKPYWIGISVGFLLGFLTCLVFWGYAVIAQRDRWKGGIMADQTKSRLIGFFLIVVVLAFLILTTRPAPQDLNLQSKNKKIDLLEQIKHNSEKIRANLERDIRAQDQILKMYQEEMEGRKNVHRE